MLDKAFYIENIPRELRSELEQCDRQYDALCKSMRKQPGYVVDWQLIDRAWACAVRLHCNLKKARRQSGELYIYHPLAVMEELAKLRCKSSLLAAALLHDTMEDCNLSYENIREDFSLEVAEIVSSVTAIKAGTKDDDARTDKMSKEEMHDYLDMLTDAKLISAKYQREAFLLRFADRSHNLSTIEACGDDKRLKKVASTKEFLIPAAKRLGMHYFYTLLSDLCFKYESKDLTSNDRVRVLEKRSELTRVSGPAYSRFDQILGEALDSQSEFSFPCFNPFAKLRGYAKEGGEEMLASSRRILLPFELRQQLAPGDDFERSRLDLWEIVLTCKQQEPSAILSRFLQFYRERLSGKGLYFEYVDSGENTVSIRLSDSLENNYRLVLLPEAKLEDYFIGNPNGEPITMIDPEAPGDAFRPQISVYSYSPAKGFKLHSKRVPAGATALDFAFIISPALAVTVKSARIHKWAGEGSVAFRDTDYSYPLKTVLSDGDVVYFDADYYPAEADTAPRSIPHAAIDWFAIVNTQHATKCLIRYLKNKYPV